MNSINLSQEPIHAQLFINYNQNIYAIYGRYDIFSMLEGILSDYIGIKNIPDTDIFPNIIFDPRLVDDGGNNQFIFDKLNRNPLSFLQQTGNPDSPYYIQDVNHLIYQSRFRIYTDLHIALILDFNNLDKPKIIKDIEFAYKNCSWFNSHKTNYTKRKSGKDTCREWWFYYIFFKKHIGKIFPTLKNWIKNSKECNEMLFNH